MILEHTQFTRNASGQNEKVRRGPVWSGAPDELNWSGAVRFGPHFCNALEKREKSVSRMKSGSVRILNAGDCATGPQEGRECPPLGGLPVPAGTRPDRNGRSGGVRRSVNLRKRKGQ